MGRGGHKTSFSYKIFVRFHIFISQKVQWLITRLGIIGIYLPIYVSCTQVPNTYASTYISIIIHGTYPLSDGKREHKSPSSGRVAKRKYTQENDKFCHFCFVHKLTGGKPISPFGSTRKENVSFLHGLVNIMLCTHTHVRIHTHTHTHYYISHSTHYHINQNSKSRTYT